MDGIKEVLELAKIRLGITDNKEDTKLEILISELGHRIIHITNQNPVPKGLYYLWSAMAKDLYLLEYPNSEVADDFIDDGGSNISIGDTTVKEGSSSGNSGSAKNKVLANNLENVIKNYRADLIHYRKMKW